MADEVSPEVIQSTQKLLGKYVTKPQLNEKLLRKPPFRFLHDVIVVLVRNGFLKGLYTDAELNSDNVKDRDAKINFLNKLITAVKTLSGKDLQAKSSKIIAGLDATETNRMLQTIAKLIDDKVDTREYVKNVKKPSKDGKVAEPKESARDKTNPKKSTSKKSVDKTSDKLDSTRKQTEKSKKGSEKGTIKSHGSVASKVKSETPKLGSKLEKGLKKNLENKDKTKIIKTDKISPKIGSKSSTPKTATDLPDAEESNALVENTAILPKMNVENEHIEIDNTVSPRDDSWKPQVLKDNAAEIEDRPPSYNATTNVEKQNDLPRKLDEEIVEDTPPIKRTSARPKSARPRSGNLEQKASFAQDDNRHVKLEPQSEESLTNATEKQKTITKDLALKTTPNETKDFNIPNNNTNKEVEEITKITSIRPKSSMLRPPSVRPSSARPAAPRLRPESSLPMKELVPLGKINVIVENFDAKDPTIDEDEDETVVIQSIPDEIPLENNFVEKSLNLNIPVDKGHLVEQILEQIQDGGQEDKAKLDWEHEGSKVKDATTKEITALRASIQALTKTANPLGKLSSYLHEDVEAMHSELKTWLKMKQQYVDEIAKQLRANNESNEPLLQQLRNLEENLKHEREEIATIKYNILRNDERIRHLVTKQIVME